MRTPSIARRNMKWILFILIAASLPGCYENPPKPNAGVLPNEIKAPISLIQAGISIDTKSASEEISTKIGTTLYSVRDHYIENHSSGSSRRKVWMSADVNRTGPINVSTNGKKITVGTSIHVTGTVYFQKCTNINLFVGSHWTCGGSHVSISGSSNISLTSDIGISSDWKLEPRGTSFSTGLGTLGFIARWNGFAIPIGPVLASKITEKRGDIISKVDAAISDLSIRNGAEEVWRMSHLSKEIDDSPFRVKFTPIEILFSRNSSETGNILLYPSITGLAKITSKVASDQDASYSELPELKEGETQNNGFIIQVPIEISYEALAKEALNKTRDKLIEALKGTQISINNIIIYPHQDKVVVAVDFAADTKWSIFDTKGTIYLYGSPAYSVETGILEIKNLDYTLETKNALADFANTIGQKYIIEMLDSILKYDTNQLNQYKVKINEAIEEIHKDNFIFKGELTLFKLNSLALTKNSIVVTVGLYGKAAIEYK
ncbi:MAG: hypothetical protein ACJAWL_002030 [Motiliproteus sp.]|jgi:hypothetical protein